MKRQTAAILLSIGLSLMGTAGRAADEVRWQKIVIDPAFRSEGVGVADINRDKKLDIVVGDFWYEAPRWRRHEIRPPAQNLGDGAHTYSECFACFAQDVNRDGWPDILVVGFPGKPCHWYENPRGKEGHWKERFVCAEASNETPIFADLFGDGKPRLVMAAAGRMCWFAPAADLDKPWAAHPVSEASTPQAKIPGTDTFSHGLGVGDVNSDGRADILIKSGWWEQPTGAKMFDAPWPFHPATLGDDCANMVVRDLDGDGRPDVVSSSAHAKGIWWFRQQSNFEWTRNVIQTEPSQTHALVQADINGDGSPDLVTGKRWWAHGPDGDVDPNAAPLLLWLEVHPGPTPRFVSHVIDDSSGIGTQFSVMDINGDRRPDIVVANKRGVFLFLQLKAKK